jgi:hypothetical protein
LASSAVFKPNMTSYMVPIARADDADFHATPRSLVAAGQ